MEDTFSPVSMAQVPANTPGAAKALRRMIGDGPFALVILFVSRAADFRAVVSEARAAFAESCVVAVASDGEICRGYLERSVVAVGFAAGHFAVEATLIDDVAGREGEALAQAATHLRKAATAPRPQMPHAFCLTLSCGRRPFEETFTTVFAATTAAVPVLGGTVGRACGHQENAVSLDGEVSARGAVLVTVMTDCPIAAFCTDHLQPTPARFVVTSADPLRSLVRTINAEPAAREYARVLGVDPAALDKTVFARHPLVFRMGERHDVRTITGVSPDGALEFCCRVDTGMVLSLATLGDLHGLLARTLSKLSSPVVPTAILVCDSALRRAEAHDTGTTAELSRLFERHRVVGLNTDGERCGPAYMSQTIAGVAIYPPT